MAAAGYQRLRCYAGVEVAVRVRSAVRHINEVSATSTSIRWRRMLTLSADRRH
jgi:hypothetical protein